MGSDRLEKDPDICVCVCGGKLKDAGDAFEKK